MHRFVSYAGTTTPDGASATLPSALLARTEPPVGASATVGPTPAADPSLINDVTVHAVAIHDPANGAKFRLALAADPTLLASFGHGRDPTSTDSATGFRTGTVYQTYDHNWRAAGTEITLVSGRKVNLAGAVIAWGVSARRRCAIVADPCRKSAMLRRMSPAYVSPTETPANTTSGANAEDKHEGPGNFVDELVLRDLSVGKNGGRLVTRFPPEPNGYLHLGHAKSICLNFGLAARHGGICNLRFDDTNPETEEVEYVESIKNDVRWLGFDWATREYYASDYFEQIYTFAEAMIEAGLAYVDSRTLDQIRDTRGDFHTPGTDSPHRSRTPAENLEVFRQMRKGAFPDGSHVLRAKGDMASTDVKMRDPVMYRIRHAKHHRTGDAWCIYPMYDWAHGQSDYIEKVTHSVCTLEFINHRPLYHWYLDQIGAPKEDRPQQIEFARLNVSYTVLSKRKLQELVAKKVVRGWDDPRMPTMAGMRRRGYTAEALRAFCDRIGVATKDGVVDVTLLEHSLREDLNARSPRVMAVLKPLKVTIQNLPEGEVLEFDAPCNPEEPEGKSRKVPLSREIAIEHDDFMESPPKKFFRLAPGQEVRLRYACIIKCVDLKKDAAGQIIEVICEWDPDSRGGNPKDGRKIKGTIHWVSKAHAVRAEVRLYDRLFSEENPLGDKEKSFLDFVNPNSLEILTDALLEPSLQNAPIGERVQFERLGYFCKDADSTAESPVWNRTITLKDAWAKEVAKH